MIGSETPQNSILSYSSETADRYYKTVIQQFLVYFDKNVFYKALKHIEEKGVVIDDTHRSQIEFLVDKAQEEATQRVDYKDVERIRGLSQTKLLVYICEIINNNTELFAEFIADMYPNEKLIALLEFIDAAFEGSIQTTPVMVQEQTQFNSHCDVYRSQITAIITENRYNKGVGGIVSGAQKSLIDSFQGIYSNREHIENGQNVHPTI